MIAVGSKVRAPRRVRGSRGGVGSRERSTLTGRAIVSTIGKDCGRDVASLLWEAMDPLPLLVIDNGEERLVRLKRSFLVTPRFDHEELQNGYDEEEDDVPVSVLKPLLEFELEDTSANDCNNGDASSLAAIVKERGDALFRLGDASAAIVQYELALSVLSTVGLGRTVVINIGGRPVLAEIDCMEKEQNEDATSFDVTFLEGDEDEGSVTERKILIGICEEDGKDRLQERILLNLSRCLLQMAEFDFLSRSTKYRTAAVLGCTLAITCCNYHNSRKDDLDVGMEKVAKTEENARLIRATAYRQLGKHKHSILDVRHVLKVNPTNKQALQMERDIRRMDHQKKNTDKKLAKELCQWVEHVTTTATHSM